MDSQSILRIAYEKHYAEKDYDEASRLYQQIIEHFPESIEAKLAKEQLEEIKNLPKPQTSGFKESETVQANGNSNKKSANIISSIIKLFGYIHIIVVISAAIVAIILMIPMKDYFPELTPLVYVLPLLIAFINSFFGFMLLGFAEIIQLLHEMNERGKNR